MPAHIASNSIQDLVTRKDVATAVFEILDEHAGAWVASIRTENQVIHVQIEGPDGFRWKAGFYQEETPLISPRIARAIAERL